MCRHRLSTTIVSVLLLCGRGDTIINAQSESNWYWPIRAEAEADMGVLSIVYTLTDVYGPRLTGSDNLRKAREWVASRFRAGGMTVREVPWEFGHRGWINTSTTLAIAHPVRAPIIGIPVAWTAGTNGPIRERAVWLPVPRGLSEAAAADWLRSRKEDFEGRIMLLEAPTPVPVSLEHDRPRLRSAAVVPFEDPISLAGPGRTQLTPRAHKEAASKPSAIDRLLLEAGVRLRLRDAGREFGHIGPLMNPTFDEGTTVPTVVIRNEDYSRIVRLLQNGYEVELESDVRNETTGGVDSEANLIAAIRAAIPTESYILLGAHLDSWHVGPGATDNAAGVAVVMSAARILMKYAKTLKHNIQFALWTGEEQGLLGSRAFVAALPPDRKPIAYLNVDGGTGRIRSMSVWNDDGRIAQSRDLFRRMRDGLGFDRVVFQSSRSDFSSDHAVFADAGIPTISFEHDPIQYREFTWHTEVDSPERVAPADLRASVAVLALIALDLATH